MEGVVRVEKHIMRSSDPMFASLLSDCEKAKSLYNRAIYILRQAFLGYHENIPEYRDLIQKGKFISWFDLNKRMTHLNEEQFRALKNNVAQQVNKDACTAFNTYFKALKEYKRNPSKFLGKPKLPDSRKDSHFHTLKYTYVSARLQKDGTINLSRDSQLPIHTNLEKFKELHVVPRMGYITILISYEKPLELKDNLNTDKAIGIDLGVSNLMAISSNDGSVCSIVNGGSLKNILYRYNKAVGKIQQFGNTKEESFRMQHRRDALLLKRNCRLDDYLHKASRCVVNLMIENNIGRCFIGLNPEWKQRCKMRRHKTARQNFLLFPYLRLIQMIQYKAELYGIKVETIRESYTSKCSYYDDEELKHHDEYEGVRKKRGCFITKDGRMVNCDINGSLNILKRGTGSHFGWHLSYFNPKNVNPDAALWVAKD